jgi:N-acyl homoserine lactone hydrolase
MSRTTQAPATGVHVETLLQGYRLGTNHGDVAFCGVNLVEGPDEHGHLRRAIVDTGHAGRRLALIDELARRGLGTSDIDVVVCTHAHWDHIENLDIFQRARIVIHRNERRYIRGPHRSDHGCPEWIDAIFCRYEGRILEVEEGDRLLPGVEVVDAPGHSAGTMAVLARTRAGTAVLAGDSIQNATVAVQRRNALVFWNEEMANRSVEKLVLLADVIYPGHDQAFRLDRQNRVEYVQDFELSILQDPDQPGLTFDASEPAAPYVMPGIEEQRYRAEWYPR